MSKEELSETELDHMAGGTSMEPVTKTDFTPKKIDSSSILAVGDKAGAEGTGDTHDGTYYVKAVKHEITE